MSRNILCACLAVCVTAIVYSRSVDANQAARGARAGRFALTSAGDSAVMLDTESGESWYLQAKNVDRPIWISIKRQRGGQAVIGGEVPAGLERRLLEAELALAKLKDNFGAQHPEVLEKEREVGMIRRTLLENR